MTHAGADIRSNMTRELERLVLAQVATREAGYTLEATQQEQAILAALELVLQHYRTWLDQDPDPAGPQPFVTA